MKITEMHINEVPENLRPSFINLQEFRETESKKVIGAFADLMQIVFLTESNMKNCMNCNQNLLKEKQGLISRNREFILRIHELESQLESAKKIITGEVN